MPKKKNDIENIKEKSIIIRPLGKRGGFDSIHLALIALAVVLVLLVVSISYTKEIIIRNESASNCTYGSSNNTCIAPVSNSSEIRAEFARIVAAYADSNSSLSLLPYLANTSTITEQYLPSSRAWLAGIRGFNPATNQSFYFSVMINDTNNSEFTPLVEVQRPAKLTRDTLVSTGVIKLGGKYACTAQKPVQVYWFIDPYSPGALASMSELALLQERFNSSVNVTLKMLYTQSSVRIADQVGIANAQALSGYLYCASEQKNFIRFEENINAQYAGTYVSPQTLAITSNQTGLNYTEMSSCLASYPQTFERQNLLSSYYNITTSPIVVTNCDFMSLPQTASSAVCYSNSTIC